MYDRLASLLAERGLHVLAFDLRGIGENATATFDRDAAADRGEFWRRAERLMSGDVDAALAALRGTEGVNAARIGVIAASCTGREAVRVAVDATTGEAIGAVVFFSTRLDPDQVTRLAGRAADLPTFWIAAEGDRRAAEAARAGARLSTHPRSRSEVYPGSAHGAPLFTEHPDLEAEIAAWLADVLG